MDLSRSAISLMASTAVSISSMVFSSERVSRRDPLADLASRPMAVSTWEGSKEPEVQADPLEAQIPFISNRISKDSPSKNGKDTFTFPGRRFSR